jgi:thermitase
MSSHIARAWVSYAAVVLLLLSLASPQVIVAQTAPACADGYALWAISGTRDKTIEFSGSDVVVVGAVRSNADIHIGGSENRITGAVEYVRRFEDAGDENSYPAPARVPSGQPPLSYAVADYAPGGAAAVAAQQAGRYTVINGDLDVSEPTLLDGLYYVKGKAKLAASKLTGTFTIVAEDIIEVSGSLQQLSPYANGLLLFSNKSEPGGSIVKLAGSNSTLNGVIYAPRGTVEISGSNSALRGAVLSDALKLSGSNIGISFAAEYCPGAPPVVAPEPYADGEVVVKLFDPGDLGGVIAAYGLDPLRVDQFGGRPIYLVGILGAVDPEVKAAELRADARVEYAEPNYATQTPEARRGRGSWVVGEGQPGYAAQWAGETIRLVEAHDITEGDKQIVAVLDTGIDAAHPAFANRLVGGTDLVDGDGDPSEVGVYGVNPGFGHGTHVAGLVALAAPEAKIMPVRVLDEEGAGNIWVLAEGLRFAAVLGTDGVPQTGDEAGVINLSLGTTRRTELLEEVISLMTCDDDDDDDDDDCLVGRSVVVVAAAGNGGDTTPQYPAAEEADGVLAVGASNQGDTRAAFSTYGDWVTLAAPGESIVSAVPGGEYGVWSGTSMAAPLAAGAAALLRAQQPALSAAAVAERLAETGRPICGAIPARLDAAAALGVPPAAPAACSRTMNTFLPSVATSSP